MAKNKKVVEKFIHIVCIDCRKDRMFPKRNWVFDTKEVYDPVAGRMTDKVINEHWEQTDTEFIEGYLFKEGWAKGEGGYVCNTCTILRAQKKK